MIEDDTVTNLSTEESLDGPPIQSSKTKKKTKRVNKKEDCKKIKKEQFRTRNSIAKTVIKEIKQKPVKSSSKVKKNEKQKQTKIGKKSQKIMKKKELQKPYIGKHISTFTRTILEALYDLNHHYNE